jgi:glycosyltransferase involved in cell wall biosynthesis
MQGEKLLSIIVPVYNSGNYLTRCLDSLVNQTIFNDQLEIIVVNDGSTDNSQQIIHHYLKKYPSIFWGISKTNSGLSAARNDGLKYVRGKYLAFLDSDDWVDPELYEYCINYLENDEKCEFVSFNYVEEWGSYVRQMNCQQKTHRSKYFMNIVVWNKIFRTKFWQQHNFSFFPGISYEDVELMPQIIFYANKVGYLNNTDYSLHYECTNQTSITKSKRYSRSLCVVFNRLCEFARDKNDKQLNQFIATNLFYQLVLFGGNPKLSYQIYHQHQILFNANNIVSKLHLPLKILQLLHVDFLLYPLISLLYKCNINANNWWATFKWWRS